MLRKARLPPALALLPQGASGGRMQKHPEFQLATSWPCGGPLQPVEHLASRACNQQYKGAGQKHLCVAGMQPSQVPARAGTTHRAQPRIQSSGGGAQPCNTGRFGCSAALRPIPLGRRAAAYRDIRQTTGAKCASAPSGSRTGGGTVGQDAGGRHAVRCWRGNLKQRTERRPAITASSPPPTWP